MPVHKHRELRPRPRNPRYPRSTRPILNLTPDSYNHSTEVQKQFDPNKMGESGRYDTTDQRISPKVIIPSLQEQQAHEETLKATRSKGPLQSRILRNSRYSRIVQRIKTAAQPTRKIRSSQHENDPQASEIIPHRQNNDTHQSGPCPQIVAQYQVRLDEIDSSYQQQLLVATQENDEKRQKISDLGFEVTARDKQINNLKSEIATQYGKIDDLTLEIAAQRKQVDSLKSEITTHDNISGDLKSEITACKTHINDITSREKNTQRQLQHITQEYNKGKKHIDYLGSEITARDAQIRTLKHTISKSRAGNSHVVPDNQIISEYNYLISQLTNWTISSFRGSRPTKTEQTILDIGISAEKPGTTFAAVYKYLTDSSGRKFLAIDMLVMWYIYKKIFAQFLFGLDEMEEKFFDDLLSSLGETSTSKEINFWRSTTTKMITATESHKLKVDNRKEEIIQELESIFVNTLPSSTDPASELSRVENLKKIISQAVELSLILRVQRPNYRMVWPPVGKRFSNTLLEPAEDNIDDSDPGSEAEDEASRRGKSSDVVGLTIFPALIKNGNEDGDNYEGNVCIRKGRALKA